MVIFVMVAVSAILFFGNYLLQTLHSYLKNMLEILNILLF